MKKSKRRSKKKRNISSIIISLILFTLISFSGISTVLASEKYSTDSFYFDINSLINELKAKFSSDNIFKTEIYLKMARENLNSLRKVNIGQINDGEAVIEILNRVEESFINNSNLLSIVKDKFKKDSTSISSTELINLLVNFRDISKTSQDLLNQIKPGFENSKILSVIDKLSHKAYIAEISSQNDIDDLADDGKLNFSVIDKIDIEIEGTIIENEKMKQIQNQHLTLNLYPENEIKEDLLNKKVKIKGIVEKDYPNRLIILSVKEEKNKKSSSQNVKLKGTLRQFGSNFVLVSNDHKKQYLLINAPYGTFDYSDSEVFITGILSGNAFIVEDIATTEVEPLPLDYSQ